MTEYLKKRLYLLHFLITTDEADVTSLFKKFCKIGLTNPNFEFESIFVLSSLSFKQSFKNTSSRVFVCKNENKIIILL
jgi:hypothetical protein